MGLIDKIKDFKYKKSIATGITILTLGTAIFHDAVYTDLARQKWREAKQTITSTLDYCEGESSGCFQEDDIISAQINARILGWQGDNYFSKTWLLKYLNH